MTLPLPERVERRVRREDDLFEVHPRRREQPPRLLREAPAGKIGEARDLNVCGLSQTLQRWTLPRALLCIRPAIAIDRRSVCCMPSVN